jgi:glycine/D-amino acid oxidase-like deaminating enzyme
VAGGGIAGDDPVIVVGGGVVGLCVAWYLAAAGVPVEVLERAARLVAVAAASRHYLGDWYETPTTSSAASEIPGWEAAHCCPTASR